MLREEICPYPDHKLLCNGVEEAAVQGNAVTSDSAAEIAEEPVGMCWVPLAPLRHNAAKFWKRPQILLDSTHGNTLQSQRPLREKLEGIKTL